MQDGSLFSSEVEKYGWYRWPLEGIPGYLLLHRRNQETVQDDK